MNANAACPLCGSHNTDIVEEDVRDFEYGAPGTYRWIKCLGCDLVRLDPMPKEEILNLAYPETYHAFVKPTSKITQYLQTFSRKGIAKSLANKLPERGAILDIGCSTGELLLSVGRLGDYQLFGIEYKLEIAWEARNRGIHVWEGAFEKAEVPDESMDLVVMQHVIEHVYDPVDTLKRIHRILRPSGIVTGELPNFRSWDAALFGKYWGGGHAPRHLFHFTPQTLKKTIEHCGLETVSITPALHTGHWALSIQNALRRKKGSCDDLTSGRTWYYPLFLLLLIPMNLIQLLFVRTGVMRFEARKPVAADQ